MILAPGSQYLNEFSHILRPPFFADQKGIILLYYNQILYTQERNQFFWAIDNALRGIKSDQLPMKAFLSLSIGQYWAADGQDPTSFQPKSPATMRTFLDLSITP